MPPASKHKKRLRVQARVARDEVEDRRDKQIKAAVDGNTAAELKCADQIRRHEVTKHTLTLAPLTQ
jgi:hypothetical protein